MAARSLASQANLLCIVKRPISTCIGVQSHVEFVTCDGRGCGCHPNGLLH